MIAVSNLQGVKLVFYWLYISWFALIVVSFCCDVLSKNESSAGDDDR